MDDRVESGWNPFSVPIRRPVAVSMFFTAVVLLGAIAWQKMPVELLPPLAGDELYVFFSRPGGEPEVVEREILLPLAARTGELPGVEETTGRIRGAGGQFTVRFQAGVDLKVREIELRRLASEIARGQPPGSVVQVQAQDLSPVSRFAMAIQVTGREDLDVLRQFVDERVSPRIAAVSGVSQVLAFGGASREVTVRVDPDRCAAMGVTPEQVTEALRRAVGRLSYLGGLEEGSARTMVVLDARTTGPQALSETRIVPGLPVVLRHVADIEIGPGRRETVQRVNGEPALGMIVFQDEGANVVRLGRKLRARLDALGEELEPYGIGLFVSFDGSKMVERQLDRLKTLAATGFLIALVILYLFLRQVRGVAVVATAVPVSLLAALSLLFLAGQSLNLITLFGLAVGIGMLVDNSIVVFEAVQRGLEHGATPDGAAEGGVRRTVRAIVAASVTNAVVFLPIVFFEFEQALTRAFLEVLALAILLPIAGSLLVAVGLVPLLARHMAAPAAVARLEWIRARREKLAGRKPPDRAREVFGGFMTVALRRPSGWITAVAAAVLITVIVALPWVAVTTVAREPEEADEVQLAVELPAADSLDRAVAVFDRLEEAVRALEGVERVESFIQEEAGSLTAHFRPRGERPEGLAARVRTVVRGEAEKLGGGLVVRAPGEAGGDDGGGGGGVMAFLGQGPAEVVLSGPDSADLKRLAEQVAGQLEALPEIGAENVWVSDRTGQDEIQVLPDARRMAAYGLTGDRVLPVLGVVGREGFPLRVGYTLRDGQEIPLLVRGSPQEGAAARDLRKLRLSTSAGVLPLAAVSDVRTVPPPPSIQHHDGRRELTVFHRFNARAPQTGPARQELESRIQEAVREVRLPPGYVMETAQTGEGFDWFKRILVPVVLLLYAVLAITFESLTLPVLVLLALPLTVLGTTWALVLTGLPADQMALVGAISLIGLTVNPAILLVDRMQHRVRRGLTSAGAAALAAVRERARPVLMTTATTVAGLWPLALVTGRENEIWPPFATVVMGGLVTSTLLTLLVIPVGFVFLNRLDRVFGRLGPWILLAWAACTAAVMTPLIAGGLIATMTWKIITTVLVAALLLGVAVWVFRKPEQPEPEATDGPPVLEVRYLTKIYGQPGPVRRAWRLPERFAERVLRYGGVPFDPVDARGRIAPLAVLAAGAAYLSWAVRSTFWEVAFLFAAVVLGVVLLGEIRRARGKADRLGRPLPGGAEGLVALALPWVAVANVVFYGHVIPRIAGARPDFRLWFAIVLPIVVFVVQAGRRTAVRLARGEIAERLDAGRLRQPRSLWRRVSRRVFGLDLPREEVRALSGVRFRAERGMLGILGPNGAGKTTLLRQLAGILDPSVGRIMLGGVPLGRLRRHLARYVGYLPQEFGLHTEMTGREYLDYYALLYRLPADDRRERVDRLLAEVGLGERADEKIGSYSGGMRQRVAVARTLLRLPPLIIVDEPTVGLDPRERIRFRNLLSRLAEGRIVLFSTHVVEDVAVACDRVIVLSRGEVAFDGRPADLAGFAEGHVWKAVVTADQEAELPAGSLVVDHVPEGEGRTRLRILHYEKPHPLAEPATPAPEDGYLLITGTRKV